MPSTRDGAPPCSGPLIAPMAPENAAATSAPVEVITRAVKVEAFMPCSAAERPVGVDRLDVLGVGLALPADQELLGERAALVDLALRDDGLVSPRADCAAYESTITATRLRSARACSSLMS